MAASATLYSIPGSHPARAVERMMELKGIEFKRVDLMPVISRAALRAMRFPGVTIPSARINGRRLTGSAEIARELDRVSPEPPLYPADPDRRRAVEEAQSWEVDALQDPVRRILWNAIRRDGSPLRSFAEGARLGVPIGLAVRTAAPIIAMEVRINGAQDEPVRADLAALGEALDRVDHWIDEGLLGDEQLNAADFVIAASLRLAMTLDDLRPHVAARPAAALAERAIPEFPGRVPPVLPAEWLEPLRAGVPA